MTSLDNNGNELPEKLKDHKTSMDHPKIRQQINKKARFLFEKSEIKSIGKTNQMSGLSQEMINEWRQNSPLQNSDPSSGSRIEEQRDEPQTISGTVTLIADNIRKVQQRVNVKPDDFGQPGFQPALPKLADDIEERPIAKQVSVPYTARLPIRRKGSMNDMIELRRIIVAVTRRWWIVLLLTLIAAATGYLISQRITPVYMATTSVIVGQSIEATNLDTRDIQTSERLALSYADIARRQPVLRATIEALDLPYNWQFLRKNVTVAPVPDTQLLEISVEAGSREEAVQVADEIAQQLILLSPASLQNQEDETTDVFVKQRLEDLQAKIEANNERLEELDREFSSATTEVQRAGVQAEINYLEGMIVQWESTFAKFLEFVGNSGSANYIAVVDEPYAKYTPVRPSIVLNTFIAGTIGFVIALGVIFFLEVIDDTLKTEEDIVQDLNLTPLGNIGRFGRHDFIDQMIVYREPFSPVSESYRMIRNNIQFMSIDNPGRSFLVTSPTTGDGKSSTSINLAIAMAQNGHRTVLVDADMRKPVLHKVFGFSNSSGLTNQFRNLDPAEKIHLRKTEIENLQVLTAGELPPNPSELLGSQRMDFIIASLKDQADMIIFDTPPAALVADATALSKHVDGVVLVVSAGKTRRDMARRALFNMQQAGANILGVVLNRSAEKNGKYTYYASSEQRQQAEDRKLTVLKNIWHTLTFANQRNRRSQF